MQTIQLKDLGAIAAQHDYKHVGLLNSTGETIVSPFGLKPLADKITQIEKRFKGQKDGTYVVRFQYAVGKKKPHYDFYLVKGEGEATPVILPQLSAPPTILPEQSVRGWNEALTDKQKIVELEAKLTALSVQNNALNQIIDEEEDEEEEEDGEKSGMMEGVQGFAEKVLPQFMPLIDKYFEQRNRGLDLREREIAIKEKGGQPRPNLRSVHPFRPLPTPDQSEAWKKYLAWMEGVTDEVFLTEMQYCQQFAPQSWPALLEYFPADETEEKTA